MLSGLDLPSPHAHTEAIASWRKQSFLNNAYKGVAIPSVITYLTVVKIKTDFLGGAVVFTNV